ncbi:MAG: peptidase M3 [Candidatus Latescibacteria bacterium]|nr:peptidase M3 [Candidatus Latescibacterota bacterium]NIO56291.1 peptidase M3 [Candidatus Latescibacterota bacterium]
MRKPILLLVVACFVFWSFAAQNSNPLLSEFDTPFGVPPFDEIKVEHYMPAFKEAMNQHKGEIDAIASSTESPSFDNTLEAMEKSGVLLRSVNDIFFSMNSALTNDEMQSIAKDIAPLLSKHKDDILLNNQIFQRVKAVYEQKDQLKMTAEQRMLLEKYYKDFVRGGANLDEQKKAELRKINEELAVLRLKFGENVLKENNAFELVIEDKNDLAGLPEAVITGAAEAAEERGHPGKWVFTLHKPSMIPFLQYSEKRKLREKISQAYIKRGDNDDELDNKKILSKMASLRVKKANLLGYKTHADFVLDENMAKTPDNVYKLLNELWKPALKRAKMEARELQKMIDKEGGNFKLNAWDWWYYAEKLKKEKYALDDELLRPYFELENVISGAFSVASKLYGIRFEEVNDIPTYHEDVKVFEVKEADGTHIGILYTDYFPRESKRGGAWMGSYRKYSKLEGKKVTPIVFNVGNFSKPTSDKPSLLSLDEVLTLFHEFGHGLHGLLSDRTYPRLSGTAVATDFVELPSQIMENWALDPRVLKEYAGHYDTDEPMPQELIDRLRKARLFNQGFATTEYLAASFLDMDWHTITEPKELDPLLFEEESLSKIGLIPEIVVRYRSPYFRHIFAGGYSAGYYSYIWAEVLDADAFQAFKEKDLYDKETAAAFRKHILAAGGTEDPMVLYKRFRGAEPKIDALLERRGLK